jgi:hypothetical protein
MKQTQNPVKQAEATRCYGALQVWFCSEALKWARRPIVFSWVLQLQSAAGQFIRQELKLAEVRSRLTGAHFDCLVCIASMLSLSLTQPSRVPFGVDKDVEDRDDDMGVKEVKALPAPAATAAAKSKAAAAAATSAASKDKSGKPATEVNRLADLCSGRTCLHSTLCCVLTPLRSRLTPRLR